MKKIWAKVPITVALLSSFFFVLAGVSFIRYIEYRDLHKTSETLDKLTSRFEKRQYLFADLIKNFVQGRNDLEIIIYHPSPQQIKEAKIRIKADHKNILKILDNYKTKVADSGELQLYDSLVVTYKRIVLEVDSVLTLFRHGETAAARAYDAQTIQPLYATLQHLNFRIADYVKERDFQHGDDLINGIIGTVAFSRNMTYLISFLLIFLGITIVFAIRHIVHRKTLLIQSEKKYQDFIEQTHELISRTDACGRVIFINNKLKQLLGYSDQDLSSLTVRDVVISDFLTDLKENIRNPEKLNAKRHIEGYMIRKNGEKVYVEGNIIWEYRGRRFDGATAFLNDVTERNLLQDVLKESETRFRKLFDMAPIPIFAAEPSGMKIFQVNEAASRFYGYSREEFLKLTIKDIIVKNDIARAASAVDMVIEENWNYNDYYKLIKKDGSVADVEIFVTKIVVEDKPFLMGNVVDITERRINENKITQTIIKTQEEERYEIGSELHDNVCQVLATAKMSLGLLKQSLPKEAEAIYNQSVASIGSATDEIRNLSHRLAPVFFKNGSLREAFERLLHTFNLEEHYKVIFAFDESAENYPLSLELQLNLYRILQEQLRNIVKYAKATQIRLEVCADGRSLWMLIADNGVGFDADKVHGGIGLANMKRRTELFSGTMTINSEPGNGCEVLITIPMENADQSSPESPAAPQNEKAKMVR